VAPDDDDDRPNKKTSRGIASQNNYLSQTVLRGTNAALTAIEK
jgi:hypothetical protein